MNLINKLLLIIIFGCTQNIFATIKYCSDRNEYYEIENGKKITSASKSKSKSKNNYSAFYLDKGQVKTADYRSAMIIFHYLKSAHKKQHYLRKEAQKNQWVPVDDFL